MYSRYTGVRWRQKQTGKKQLHSQQIGGHSRVSAKYDILPSYWNKKTDVPQNSWLLFDKWCSGLYGSDLCSPSCRLTWEVFTTTSTREIQLCARPATQLTGSFYFRQIVHARRRFKWKVSIHVMFQCCLSNYAMFHCCLNYHVVVWCCLYI